MFRYSIRVFVLGAFWTMFVVTGFYQGWFLPSLAPAGNLNAFSEALEAKVKVSNVGNISLVVIENNQIAFELHESIGKPVSVDTVFQIASASKWVTALGVLSLVDQGKLALDVPVSHYLTRWQLPASTYDHDQVTVRRLLSHTAALSSFGYFGFENGEDRQTLEASLSGAADASPPGVKPGLSHGVTRIETEPGSGWDYTGSGYMLLQLVIEEVSGEDFATFMEKSLFVPLGMTNSTFDWRRVSPADLADFYDADGSKAHHYVYSATAAASLYSSTGDIARVIQAHFNTTPGDQGNRVVSKTSLELARKPEGRVYGLGVYGLGAFLYASNNQGDVIFGHDGSNYPAINTALRINPATGDSIIVFSTGSDSGLATRLAGDWVLWNTGNPDLVSLLRVHAGTIALVIIIGWLVILVGTLILKRVSIRRNSVD